LVPRVIPGDIQNTTFALELNDELCDTFFDLYKQRGGGINLGDALASFYAEDEIGGWCVWGLTPPVRSVVSRESRCVRAGHLHLPLYSSRQ
jgi:hypothetical protein